MRRAFDPIDSLSRLALLGMVACALAAAPQLPAFRVESRPTLAIAPQDMHVRVFVARDLANRWIEVSAIGPRFSRSTGLSMEGQFSPAVYEWWWLALPCGRYAITARVTQQDGSSRTTHDQAEYAC